VFYIVYGKGLHPIICTDIKIAKAWKKYSRKILRQVYDTDLEVYLARRENIMEVFPEDSLKEKRQSND